MTDPKDPPTLENIDARLKAARDAGAEKQKAGFRDRENSRGMGLGMRIGIELVVSVLAGGGIGLFIDSLTKGLDQAVGLGRAIRDKEAAESDTGKTGGDETGETKTKAPE